MKNLIKRQELADLLGVSGGYVTRLCKGELAAACEGKLVDRDHPKVQARLRKKAAGKMPKAGKEIAKRGHKPPEGEDEHTVDLSDLPEDIRKVAHLPLIEILRKFGTQTAFEKWLGNLQKIEAINEKMLKNAEKAGELVHRDMVRGSIIEPTDAFLIKLLTDGRRTVPRKIYTMCKAGESLQEAEKAYESLMSAMIKPLKAKIKRAGGR